MTSYNSGRSRTVPWIGSRYVVNESGFWQIVLQSYFA